MRLETNSEKDRTLFSKIVEKNKITSKHIETNWNLSIESATAACVEACQPGAAHKTAHVNSGQEPQ